MAITWLDLQEDFGEISAQILLKTKHICIYWKQEVVTFGIRCWLCNYFSLSHEKFAKGKQKIRRAKHGDGENWDGPWSRRFQQIFWVVPSSKSLQYDRCYPLIAINWCFINGKDPMKKGEVQPNLDDVQLYDTDIKKIKKIHSIRLFDKKRTGRK